MNPSSKTAILVVVQTYQITSQFLSKEWIMEKWDAGYYITAVAGAPCIYTLGFILGFRARAQGCFNLRIPKRSVAEPRPMCCCNRIRAQHCHSALSAPWQSALRGVLWEAYLVMEV